MKTYREAYEKFAPKDRWGIFFYAGIIFTEPMVEGLRRAGRNLTVDTFVKAMESIRDFKGIGPRISYGPGQRQGTRSVFLAKCGDNGSFIQISDWMTSDVDLQAVLKRLGR
jgi:hypothetical protein